MESNHKKSKMEMSGKDNSYKKLSIMLVLSFISMYILMYSMVNSIKNVYPNINQFYMAALMTMPMMIIELGLMGKMYMNKKLNTVLISISSAALIAFFLLIQYQTGVTDRQFLRGMIPHHAAAILMSEQSKTQDPEIMKLQQEIISSQQQEIAEMKAILKRLKK
ncbi:MAG: DUF305 domain-containing protein [Chitinophagaceae bacterium]|nr:DUF305 domain-containing protein [Chitinophagaceae bacterium]